MNDKARRVGVKPLIRPYRTKKGASTIPVGFSCRTVSEATARRALIFGAPRPGVGLLATGVTRTRRVVTGNLGNSRSLPSNSSPARTDDDALPYRQRDMRYAKGWGPDELAIRTRFPGRPFTRGDGNRDRTETRTQRVVGCDKRLASRFVGAALGRRHPTIGAHRRGCSRR